MTNTARDKGSRIEREIAHKLTDLGVPTRRVIGSGAHGKIDQRLEGDLQIGTYGPHGAEWLLTGEVKARKDGQGFAQLEGWLGDNDLLLLRRNNRDPYAFLPWSTLVSLLKAYYDDQLNQRVNPYGDNQHSGSDLFGNEYLHGGKK